MRICEGKRDRIVVIFTVGIIILGTVPFAAAGGSDGEMRLEAIINGDNGQGSGHAKFEARDDRITISIEIEDVMLPCKEFAATIGGMQVYGNFIEDNGVCDLNLDTKKGDSVPAAVAGDEVIVTCDAVTLFGILHFK